MLLRRFISDSEGVAAVEAALLFPLFLIVVIGAVDASNLLLERQRVEQGLELGANYLAKTRVPDDHFAQARNLAATNQLSAGGTSDVRGWSPSDITITTRDIAAGATAGSVSAGRTVILESAHVYRGFGLISAVSRNSVRVRARHEERVDL